MGICWVFMSRPKTSFRQSLWVNKIATSVTKATWMLDTNFALGYYWKRDLTLVHGGEAQQDRGGSHYCTNYLQQETAITVVEVLLYLC